MAEKTEREPTAITPTKSTVTKATFPELVAKQIWQTGPKENPFETVVRVSISDVKQNYKGDNWVKFSRYNPNVGNTPFEYLSEKDFRTAYPLYVNPEN
jgi:hypothetical protein